MKTLLILLFFITVAVAQPILPSPSTTRLFIWPLPNSLDNAGGYLLRWGTNSMTIVGASNTSAIVKLDPGIQQLILRTTPILGTNFSDPVSLRVHVLYGEIESSTNSGLSWFGLTNFTYVVSPSYTGQIYRTKIDWLD